MTAEGKVTGEVLFKIVTIDVECAWISSDGQSHPEVMPGGDVYEVIAVNEGMFYVTNQWYKPGVPQLIPWSCARRLED